MKVAIISDIHGNLPALNAVLEHIKKQDADKILCCGDLVGYAPYPDEVIGLMKEKQILSVRGNYDDTIGYQKLVCGCDFPHEEAQALGEQSVAWTLENVSQENKDFLRSLPERILFSWGSHNVLFVHGSPTSMTQYLPEDIPDEILNGFLRENKVRIMVCGHVHKAFARKVEEGLVINAGSVGKPKSGSPDAHYAVLTLGEEVSVAFFRVSYDYESVCEEIVRSGLPEEFAGQLREGRGW